MNVIKLKSGSAFEDKLNYSRAVSVGDYIFVSNTAGRNYATRELSKDPAEQAEQAFATIERALNELGSSLADTVRMIVSIPYLEDAEAIAKVVGRRMEGINPASTTHNTPLMSPDYRVEIEITAYRGLSALPQENRRVQF